MRLVLQHIGAGHRYVTVLSLVAVGLAAAVAPASDVPHIGPRIASVRVGLRNLYKLGCWTPISVEIDAGLDADRNKNLRVDVIVSDSDGVPTTASSPVYALSEDGTSQIVVYTQVGRIGSPIQISLHDSDQVLDERTFLPKNTDAAIPIVPVTATSEWIVSLGTATFGLGDAFPDRSASGRQTGRKTIELKEISDLPENWFGYDGVDVILLSVGDGKFCSSLAADKERMAALERWVELGGRLVILCDGTNATAMLGAGGPLAALLPGKFVESVRIPESGVLEHYAAVSANAAAAIAPQPAIRIPRLTDVTGSVELYSGKRPTDPPLIVRTSRGFGEITFVGVELSRPPLSTWSGRTLFLRALLRPYVADSTETEFGNQKLMSSGIFDLSGALRQQLGRRFSNVVTLGFPTIAALAIAYLVVLGPVDYFVTRRWLRRTLLAWITFPLIIVSFAAIALAVGSWSKGAATAQINRIELVDFDTVGGQVRGTFWATLYSPDARLFDLKVKPAVIPGSSPSGVETLFSWWGLPGIGIGGMQTTGSDLGIVRAGYRYGAERDSLEKVPLLVSAAKSVIARWNATTNHRFLNAKLADEDGLATGSVTNHTGVVLKNARLLYGGWAYRLGNLKPEETIDVGAELSPRSTKTIVTRDALGSRGATPGGVESNVFSAEAASAMELVHLMMFYAAAGGFDFAHLPNEVQPYCDLSRQLNLGQAVFIAEAVTDGTKLVDAEGQEIGDAEADTSIVMYRFLLPVERPTTP